MSDMSMSGEEQKDFCTPVNKAPKYPHGLQLRLTPVEVKKLNLQSIPAIDSVMELECKVKVMSVSTEEDGQHSLCLQVIEMEIEKNEGEKNMDTAKVLYGVS